MRKFSEGQSEGGLEISEDNEEDPLEVEKQEKRLKELQEMKPKNNSQKNLNRKFTRVPSRDVRSSSYHLIVSNDNSSDSVSVADSSQALDSPSNIF